MLKQHMTLVIYAQSGMVDTIYTTDQIANLIRSTYVNSIDVYKVYIYTNHTNNGY